MRRIINGKTYDTNTAEEVCALECRYYPGDFQHHETSLYRTPRGGWFLSGHGGPSSMWSRSVGQNSWSGGEGIQPLSRDEALAVLEGQGETDLIERYFGEMPEAGDGEEERDGFALRLPKWLKDRAQELAASEGVSLNSYVVEALRQKTGGGAP
jgi:hypothetical protein